MTSWLTLDSASKRKLLPQITVEGNPVYSHICVSLCVFSSPHIIFLSQSVLAGNKILCGTRICHEIAHSWFGLAIGARDWTEEWISEGFATYLEDVFWAKVQQVSETTEKSTACSA